MATATLQVAYADDQLYEEHERVRAKALRSLIEALRRYSQDTEEVQFTRIFARAQVVLEVEDDQLARILMVSRPTVGRWARGDSAPHPLARPSVIKCLIKIAEAKLRLHSGR